MDLLIKEKAIIFAQDLPQLQNHNAEDQMEINKEYQDQHHILKVFEEGKNINKKKVNIKKAINYLADAWENVTDETIFNYWIKPRILFTSTENDIENAIQTQQHILNHETEDTDQLIKEEMDENKDDISDDSEDG
ncbi:hypothetical protein C1645_816486 [Glomus cerebriforme]|uniref:DDE-1 domain-containing protein n=1 Tax=Glomus cerebriforme TaxID=658196 RepID=A0A397TBB2_9GLOM|nr:hypothetical protein C1645_816486 [Glomus cerebriforme]